MPVAFRKEMFQISDLLLVKKVSGEMSQWPIARTLN
jgi:hypothetical protein